MTRSAYIVARVFSTFGLAPLEKFRTAAAFEAHLLRDAETIMGELAWDSLEEMEEVSSEYWQLRKITKARDELEVKISALNEELEEAQEARVRALEEVAEVTKDKVDARDKAAEKIDRLHQERDDIQRDGRTIKRVHSGLKTKLEVLLEEFDNEESPDISKTREELKLKRLQFEKIKERHRTIDKRIAELQEELSELNQVIEKENDTIREKAEKQFSTIGKTNKELTDLGNKVGVIDVERSALFAEVGRHVLQNSKDPTIRKAAQKQRGLLSLIDEIRASSNRHRRLIGN
ncbi:MAG: hypothetical protein ACSHYB_06400 [Roseibacillus sp.]